ncbi:hypothetical protein QTL95_18265 [Rhizobium sp. S152]|uniref:hypothetical protein n=1 Tax=Rhizobium sp. S152 TaxID=3055038 RepID=UPI0025A935A9|nr:hypothetical protein [Rhizobium sp. S152]MDM9627839.1 hypothetical protein [Rhizobium sp. S152]
MSGKIGATRPRRTDEMPAFKLDSEGRGDVDAALAWHDDDARATIATLLLDCAHLRGQLDMASRCLSRGLTRGWRPELDRTVDDGSSGPAHLR